MNKMKIISSFTLKRENINFSYISDKLISLDLSWYCDYRIRVLVGGTDNSEPDVSDILELRSLEESNYLDNLDNLDKLDIAELNALDEWCDWCEIVEEVEFCLEDLYEEDFHGIKDNYEDLEVYMHTETESESNEIDITETESELDEIDITEIYRRSMIIPELLNNVFGRIMRNKDGYYIGEEGLVYDDYYMVTIEEFIYSK